MFKTVLFAGGLVLASTWPVRATLIAAWDFKGVVAAPSTPATFAATAGSGSLDVSLFSPTLPTQRTSFTGAGSVNTFTGAESGTGTALGLQNNSANGKSIVFSLNMSGFQDLILTFATQGTASGFNNHQWRYSNDGTAYTALSGNNTAVTVSGFVIKTVDFSSISALDNDNTIFIELIVSGATASSGNNRFDNVQFNATAVPEASTWVAGLGLSLGMLGTFVRKHRK